MGAHKLKEKVVRTRVEGESVNDFLDRCHKEKRAAQDQWKSKYPSYTSSLVFIGVDENKIPRWGTVWRDHGN